MDTAERIQRSLFSCPPHVPARRYDGADSVRWHQDTTEQQWCITKGIVGDWFGQENDRGQEDWKPQNGSSFLYFPAHPMFLPAATTA
ncbi:hypothetical protein [Novipirellula rosea]|uniref:hypothetical protein n=1 Tax=Novipirellula rosea TaxID=1031540 RepID=UPI0031EBB8EB